MIRGTRLDCPPADRCEEHAFFTGGLIVPDIEVIQSDPDERVANTTEVEVPSPPSPQPSASSAISATSQEEKNNSVNEDCYDVPSIIRERRRCKRGKTAEQLIECLSKTEKCSDRDLFLVGHDAGKWLIENCTRKNFPTADEFLKMAKSINFYFPSTRNVNSSLSYASVV